MADYNKVSEDGAVWFPDSAVGGRVDAFEKKGFPFTAEGLELCQQHVFGNQHIRNIIEAILSQSSLGFLKVFGKDKERIFAFINNGLNMVKAEPPKVLVVLLLSSNARIVFYKRSHLHPLQAQPTRRSPLLVVSPSSLNAEDIESIEGGGVAIIDGRLAFQILEGFIITMGFAAPEELKYWQTMRFPITIRHKVQEMRSENIGLNIEYIPEERPLQ